MSYLDELPIEKEMAHLLREAKCFVHDAGADEDPEAKSRACELLEQIERVLGRTVY